MKKQEIVQESIRIIAEYYDGNLQPYFDAIDDAVLWYGPRGGMVLQGKEAIVAAWEASEHDLRFSMGNIEAKTASTGSSNLEVMLEYHVYTYFPNGSADQHHQRLHYSWGYHGRDAEGKRIPKIFMIHISNVTEEEDSASTGNPQVRVYASSLSDSRVDAVSLPDLSRVHFRTVYAKGENEVIYYFNAATVLWIESADGGRHSIIHTLEGSCKSIEKLRSFEDRYPEVFLRAHASHLVNPLHVRTLRRFEVTMADGTALPVPQKKYTAFKRELESWDGSRTRTL